MCASNKSNFVIQCCTEKTKYTNHPRINRNLKINKINYKKEKKN